MKELRDWLERVAALTPTSGDAVQVRMRRLLAPSFLHFDNSIFRISETDLTHFPIGTDPSRLSVLVWPDEGSDNVFRDPAVASELGAMLTFLTNRRVEVAASETMLTSEDTNRMFLPMSHADGSLAGPVVDILAGPVVDIDVKAQCEDHLGRLLSLSSDDVDAIGAAINLHYASVLLQDVDLSAAYALAVAGVERLSRSYGNADFEWSDWSEASRFDQAFAELALDADQRDRLREEMLGEKQLRLRQTFATYVIETLPDDFWTGSIDEYQQMWQASVVSEWTFLGQYQGSSVRIDTLLDRETTALRKRLLTSYDARSSYVHAGQRDVDMRQVFDERTGRASGKRPIDYAALRAILRALIRVEIDARSKVRGLPDVRLVEDVGERRRQAERNQRTTHPNLSAKHGVGQGLLVAAINRASAAAARSTSTATDGRACDKTPERQFCAREGA